MRLKRHHYEEKSTIYEIKKIIMGKNPNFEIEKSTITVSQIYDIKNNYKMHNIHECNS